MRCGDHALTEMVPLAGLVSFFVEFLLARPQQLLGTATGGSAAARALATSVK